MAMNKQAAPTKVQLNFICIAPVYNQLLGPTVHGEAPLAIGPVPHSHHHVLPAASCRNAQAYQRPLLCSGWTELIPQCSST